MATKGFTAAASSPLTKIRAEQIKAELVSGGALSDDLDALKTQVAEIIGGTWDQSIPADAPNVQLLDLAAHLSASSGGSKMEVLKNLDVVGQITGSAVRAENLSVDGGVVFTNVSGDLDNDSKFVFDGSALKVSGEISGSGALKAGGEATLASAIISDLTEKRVVFAGTSGALVDDANFVFDIAGATDVLKVVGDISGSNALKSGGTLDVAGNSALAGTLTVTSTSQFNDNVTIAASKNLTVGGDATITGNLTVNGTTTTVNSTTITVDDKNIELGSVGTPTDLTADGGGITLKGATDKTIIWRDAQDAWEFSEHLVPSGTLDLGLTGDRWQNLWLAGDATVGGTVAATGGISAAHLTASNLDNQQIAFAFSDAGEIVGSANLLWTGAQLKVGGQVSGSGDFLGGANATFAAQVGAGSARITGLSDLRGGSNLSGSVYMPARGTNRILITDGGRQVVDNAGLSYNSPSGQFELLVGTGSNQIHFDAAAKKIWSADLTLSGTSTLTLAGPDGASLLFNNDATSWSTFSGAAVFSGVTSIVGAFNALASAAAGSASKVVKKIAAGEVTSVEKGDDIRTVVGLTLPGAYNTANTMVYVNGQLLISGSAADVAASPAVADYSFDGGAFKLSFDLQADDVVVVQKI